MFGVYLLPTHDLNNIAERFQSQGAKRCLVEVYGKYKNCHGPPSWEKIVEALRKMENNSLAGAISMKYLNEENDLIQLVNDGEIMDNGMDEQECDGLCIFIHDEAKDEFDSLRFKYSKVVLVVKNALKAQEDINIDDLQSVVQDHCGLQPLPSPSLDSVFQRMKQHMSCFDVSLLLNVAGMFVEHVYKKIVDYRKDLNAFKSSTLMKQIVADVKDKRQSPAGTKVITLKVSQAWNNVTISDFERLVNIVLHSERLSKIQVTEGCMCITWIAPGLVEVEKPKVYSKDFMDAMAVLFISVGDKDIYRRQDQSDAPVSLDLALLQSLEEGVIDAVELLLAVGANPYLSLPSGDIAITAIVNMRDKDGSSVLHSAYKHADVASLLLSEGCDPDVADIDGYTPIMMASKHGHCDTLSALIAAGADVNKADKFGVTPLMEAAKAGHFNIITTLINAHADANKADNIGFTPLMEAARAGHNNIVTTLIDARADVNKADDKSITPLMEAARVGHDNVVATLLGAGADINKADNIGTTPLMEATRAGHDGVATTLVVSGANVDHEFVSELIIKVCSRGNDHLLQKLLSLPEINIDKKVMGVTALGTAVQHNYSSIVTALLLYGTNPNVSHQLSIHACTPSLLLSRLASMPLMIASFLGNKEMAQSLLQHNANVDYQDKRTGYTPLMAASRQEHREIVQLLLEWGADVDAKNVHQDTAVDIAERRGFSDIATILRSHTTMLPYSDATYQVPSPATSSSQSPQCSLDGHYCSASGGSCNISSARDTEQSSIASFGDRSIGNRSEHSIGSVISWTLKHIH